LAIAPLTERPRKIAQELTPICALQGSGFSTPYAGQSVTTQGVVQTAAGT